MCFLVLFITIVFLDKEPSHLTKEDNEGWISWADTDRRKQFVMSKSLLLIGFEKLYFKHQTAAVWTANFFKRNSLNVTDFRSFQSISKNLCKKRFVDCLGALAQVSLPNTPR